MIEINNLVKKYGSNIALDGISFSIENQESIAIIGGNGSGKTTLVEIIAGVLDRTSGEILIDGISSDHYENIGIQFQEGNWPKGTTAKRIIKFYTGKSKFEQLNDLINIFEIEGFLNKDLNNLSGGQKQRFNAFLAILNNPKVIILDELITGLDLKMQLRLINFFNDYKKENNATLILISHMPEEVEILCNRLILLDEGKIVLDKSVEEVKKESGSVRAMLMKHYEI